MLDQRYFSVHTAFIKQLVCVYNLSVCQSVVCVRPSASTLTGRRGFWEVVCPGGGRGLGSARCRAVKAVTCAAACSSPSGGR